ncbi:putative mediator of RNA polymerase II transcription subunit 15 [Toxorhynchites rutilus septentrionalis]|uniref:putative mediator of RNA polymerase II transcription subunit 15 n=1 Tax=Toxorhynchites rutilus septentrionalis TaxID=329112 RepID=UPI002479C68B|nr:putative mediator of RNA polymerase II transcription subunit 15 [Toxorhynchites rutilus septentrionalis]XP_055638727.1 putative mediator of RNA polymerase II transcription subunit 15 [Toxorhynchites rutilus septentrionalis]
MSSKLQQALNLSLDEYIAKKNIVANVCSEPENTSRFKRQLRSDQDDNDDDDDTLSVNIQNEMDVEVMGDTPPPLIRHKSPLEMIEDVKVVPNFPGRFITEEQKRGLRIPSQQWRLQRDNQTGGRSDRFPFTNANNNNGFRINHINNRFNQRKWNNRNNFRNQYGKNPKMVGSFNPRSRWNNVRNNIQTNGDLRSLITTSSSGQIHGSSFDIMSGNGMQTFRQPQLVTFADMLSRIGQASSSQDRDSFSAVIGNIMRNQQQQQQQQQQQPQQGMITPILNQQNIGQMSSNELMPFAAQTLLNHITTVQQNFGPKYDMKVQKQIHTLQGKSMMYSSLGVVSTDGPGIDSERIVPKTTDLSMNMRFS